MRNIVALLLLVGFAVQAQAASLSLSQCGQETIALQDYMQFYHDKDADKGLAEIQQLADQDWQPLNKKSLSPGVTRSAYWYRLVIDNQTPALCNLWIDLNTFRVTDVQMYSQYAAGGWQTQRFGVAYPVSEWASNRRIASLPVLLPAQSSSPILLRLQSAHAFAINPLLLSEPALVKERMAGSLIDGITIGVVGLLIAFSLWVGFFLRLKILLTHGLAVLFYTLYMAVLVGYAFLYLWPSAVQWNGQAVIILDIAAAVLLLSYLRVLLQVKKQVPLTLVLMTSAQLALIAYLVLRLLLPHVQWLDQGQTLKTVLHVWVIVAILAALYCGTQRKLAYNWFSYFLPLVVVAQSISQLLFSFGANSAILIENSWFAASVLPAALLLAYTLASQIVLGRQREQLALADIEQLKRAEQETLEQRVELRTEQLREALRKQNMLLARISHDLRSPLLHVIRDAGLLQQSTAQAQQYGQSIQRAAYQQLELIDELLEYSRGELKQLELLVAPGYLFGFLREIEETGAFLAESHHNTFNSYLANDLPLLVNADFRRLRQVIVNLLANAAKFTQAGHIELSVSVVQLDKQAGYAEVLFQVADNGVGIPAAERESLLQPFQRGANTAHQAGVGLGLYIVRQLLDSMHSELHLQESASGGVCSSFTLRLELAAEQELEQVFIEGFSPNSEGQQRCVLIVDDVAITQEMLYELLAGYDYNPITCDSAAEALLILRDSPVDIIITDQVMPVMDGWDLLRRVRQEWPELPVLLYSARPPVRPAGLDASIDFDACLLKPAVTSELLEQLQTLLR